MLPADRSSPGKALAEAAVTFELLVLRHRVSGGLVSARFHVEEKHSLGPYGSKLTKCLGIVSLCLLPFATFRNLSSYPSKLMQITTNLAHRDESLRLATRAATEPRFRAYR